MSTFRREQQPDPRGTSIAAAPTHTNRATLVSGDLTMQALRRTVGCYLLEEEIGRGGMGVVYRARRADTGETVAVKLMLPEIAANNHFRARFVREASLGSDLDHPNIVPIYDAGEDAGSLFIAMRLVEGRDLKTLIEEEGPLDPKRVVSLMRQVAAALDAAHESGLVHHDVKPQNILLDAVDGNSETAYVTDFGLVRPAGSESTASRTGQVFGSIQYMAPEQVEGMPVDGRADVYALGCVLFECLTGQIPFDRPNEVAVLWAHVHEAPARVTDIRPELPGGLDSVVATALAKRPEDRFLTCGELVEELEKGVDRKHRPVVMPIVRPLVKRIPRAKTEREVWAPNYFPELSRIKKVSNKVNWIQVAGVTSILCLLAAALVQFAHPRGVRGAVTDVAAAVGTEILDAGVKVSSAFTKEDPAQAAIGGTTADARGDRGRTASAASGEPALRASAGPRSAGSGAATSDKEGADSLARPSGDSGSTDSDERAETSVRQPRSGTYVFEQTGHEAICPEDAGCTEGADLPETQEVRISSVSSTSPTEAVNTVEVSPRFSVTSRLTYSGGRVGLLESVMSFSTSDGAYTVRLRPRPSTDLLLLPLKPQRRWEGSWTSSPVEGRYFGKVLGRGRTRVGSEIVRTVQVKNVVRWGGSHAGVLETVSHIDPETLLAVETTGYVRSTTGEEGVSYEANFRTLLTRGPGYRD
ncbi:MAG: protein kinase [Actinomycetota bacterium]|nr:protein kinase [Actinomycetota bacterium]